MSTVAITDINWPSGRSGGRRGVGVFRTPSRFNPIESPVSDPYSSFGGRTYVYAKDVGKAILAEEVLRRTYNNIPKAVEQLPVETQTTLQQVTNTTSAVFSNVIETGKSAVGAGARILSPINTALNWGAWGLGISPTFLKIAVVVVAGVSLYKIFWSRGSGGSSSSAAHVNLNIHINGQSGGPISIETTGDKKSSVKVTPGNFQGAGKKLRCEPVGTGPNGAVLLSCQTETENYVSKTPFIYAWRIRKRLEKCQKDPVVSDALKQEIQTFLARKNTPSKEQIEKGYWDRYFMEANELYEKVYQNELAHTLETIPRVPLRINRLINPT